VSDYDIGIDVPVSFGPGKHQGLDVVYYTTVREGRPIPIRDWRVWAK
jgi:branched-chain amino acid transport system substrate-binding protein